MLFAVFACAACQLPHPNVSRSVVENAGLYGGVVTTSVSTFGSYTGNLDFGFPVYDPNTENIFLTPHTASQIQVINPRTKATALIGDPKAAGETWFAGAYAPVVQKIFFPPLNGGTVLVLNPATNATDTTAFGTFTTVGHAFGGVAYDSGTQRLFVSPSYDPRVMIIDPVANTSAEIGRYPGRQKWTQLIRSTVTGLLYACPVWAGSVLVIDPATNSTGTVAIPFGSNHFWLGFAEDPRSGKIFGSPGNGSMLVVDTRTNETAEIAMNYGHYASSANDGLFRAIAWAPNVRRFILVPDEVPNALEFNPDTNTSREILLNDTSIPSGLGDKFGGILFCPVTNELIAAPRSSPVALTIGFSVALDPEVVLQQLATLARAQAEASTVCNRPVCAEGTTPQNGECVPDCGNLRRRGISCEPYCDANGPSGSSGSSGPSESATAIIVAVVVVIVVAVIGVAWVMRPRSRPANEEAGNGLAQGHPVFAPANEEAGNGLAQGHPVFAPANEEAGNGLAQGNPVFAPANEEAGNGLAQGNPVFAPANEEAGNGLAQGHPVFAPANEEAGNGVAQADAYENMAEMRVNTPSEYLDVRPCDNEYDVPKYDGGGITAPAGSGGYATLNDIVD